MLDGHAFRLVVGDTEAVSLRRYEVQDSLIYDKADSLVYGFTGPIR